VADDGVNKGEEFIDTEEAEEDMQTTHNNEQSSCATGQRRTPTARCAATNVFSRSAAAAADHGIHIPWWQRCTLYT